jgi:hypothetical protein
MFPSQPQIGQDMARERQELAARMRQVSAVRPVRSRRPERFKRLRSLGLRSLFKRPLHSLERGAE